MTHASNTIPMGVSQDQPHATLLAMVRERDGAWLSGASPLELAESVLTLKPAVVVLQTDPAQFANVQRVLDLARKQQPRPTVAVWSQQPSQTLERQARRQGAHVITAGEQGFALLKQLLDKARPPARAPDPRPSRAKRLANTRDPP